MTSSGSGLYGNFGQANYSAALVSFSNTLAREGEKYNIFCNAIAPIAASAMTANTMPEEVFNAMKPTYVAPLIGYLCHETSSENGGVFELGAGQYYKGRWQRTKGVLFKADKSFTPGSILSKFNDIINFDVENVTYPSSISEVDWTGLVDDSKTISSNPQGKEIDFKNQVALVTGAGGGLGKQYALLLGSLGATVVVNDLGKVDGVYAADLVVKEICSKGGKAVADYNSVTDGDVIIGNIIKQFQRIDIIINNAGILRDKSFVKMTDQDWDLVYDIHMGGTYKVTKAAWQHMVKQKYGRIINTSSAVGLYGNFGQTNYSTAKGAILGFSNCLRLEGERNNILVSTIVPNAGTNMTATIMPSEMVEMLKPDYVAPLVVLLASKDCPVNGGVYEVGSCWISSVRRQRAVGANLASHYEVTPELIQQNWDKVVDFDSDRVAYPNSVGESLQLMYQAFEESKSTSSDDCEVVRNAKSKRIDEVVIPYTVRDVILYAISLGAEGKELDLVYENHENFCTLPTFPITYCVSQMVEFPFDEIIPNFNLVNLVHGEQYYKALKPTPTSGKIKCRFEVRDLLDKDKFAVAILASHIFDENGEKLGEGESTLVIRKAGGFGGSKERSVKVDEAIIANNDPPSKSPDFTFKQKIERDQAVLYRLNGDLNPLHIDQDFATMAGFKQPILHGLCSYGIACKARFAKHVFPGETLEVQAWINSPNKVLFNVKVVERNELCVSNGAMEFYQPIIVNSRL